MIFYFSIISRLLFYRDIIFTYFLAPHSHLCRWHSRLSCHARLLLLLMPVHVLLLVDLLIYIYIENMVLQKDAEGVSNRVTVNVFANMSSNLFFTCAARTLSRWVRLPSLGIADVLTLNIF